VYNCPDSPNYTAAYNWLWSSAETECIFNLEDDWELIEDVNIPSLLKYFKKHPNLYVVPLRAYKYRYMSCPTSPGIMHERYYKKIGGNLNVGINPETQLRGRRFGLEMPSRNSKISSKGKVLVYPKQIKRVIIRDIGRSWAAKHNFIRGKKCRFITWETK
jgi:hypothetical protein